MSHPPTLSGAHPRPQECEGLAPGPVCTGPFDGPADAPPAGGGPPGADPPPPPPPTTGSPPPAPAGVPPGPLGDLLSLRSQPFAPVP